jgi:hypothetical protein
MDFNVIKNSPLMQIGIILVVGVVIYLLVRMVQLYTSDPYKVNFFVPKRSMLNPAYYINPSPEGGLVSGNGGSFTGEQFPPMGSTDIQKVSISKNESGGMEFSYSFFLYVSDYYNPDRIARMEDPNDGPLSLNSYSMVLTKGKRNGAVRCPAVGLHPSKNSMVIFMNTFSNPDYKVEIDNLPVQKWFAVAIVVKGKRCDVYINGDLKRSFIANSVIKQNNYPIYFGYPSGFNGQFTNGSYYRYALEAPEIKSLANKGPNMTSFTNIDEVAPPYYRTQWWLQ